MWSPVFGTPAALAEAAAELDDAWRAGAQRLVDEGVDLARETGFDAEPLLAESRHGAWRTIVALADEGEARLIVTGSHGISPAASRLLGSVAAGVVHHAARPVLVVPAPSR
jgi:nucleotide-binding universal stress UspA family protein